MKGAPFPGAFRSTSVGASVDGLCCSRHIKGLTSATQDAIARVVPQLAGDDVSVDELSADEAASFAESFAQAARGAFATDEQIQSIWAKHEL